MVNLLCPGFSLIISFKEGKSTIDYIVEISGVRHETWGLQKGHYNDRFVQPVSVLPIVL